MSTDNYTFPPQPWKWSPVFLVERHAAPGTDPFVELQDANGVRIIGMPCGTMEVGQVPFGPVPSVLAAAPALLGACKAITNAYPEYELAAILARPCNGSPLSMAVHALALAESHK